MKYLLFIFSLLSLNGYSQDSAIHKIKSYQKYTYVDSCDCMAPGPVVEYSDYEEPRLAIFFSTVTSLDDNLYTTIGDDFDNSCGGVTWKAIDDQLHKACRIIICYNNGFTVSVYYDKSGIEYRIE